MVSQDSPLWKTRQQQGTCRRQLLRLGGGRRGSRLQRRSPSPQNMAPSSFLGLWCYSLVVVEPSGEGDEACCAVQACGPRTVSWCWLRVAPLFPCPCQPGCLYIPSASSSELAPGLAARLSRNRCCRSEPGSRPGQGPRPPAGRSQAWPATSPSAALRSPRTLVLHPVAPGPAGCSGCR